MPIPEFNSAALGPVLVRLEIFGEIDREGQPEYLAGVEQYYPALDGFLVARADIAFAKISDVVSANNPDDATLRAELIRLAALSVIWIECIDRRANAPKEDANAS